MTQTINPQTIEPGATGKKEMVCSIRSFINNGEAGIIRTKSEAINLDLANYNYKMIRSIDFYNHCRSQLKDCRNLTWKIEEVNSVSDDNMVKTTQQEYFGKNIYDSRVSSAYHDKNSATNLKQHFIGWTIETSEPTFDPSQFMMMDFRNNISEKCSFTYILPEDEKNSPCRIYPFLG